MARKTLIVEDSATDAIMTKELLEKEGMEVQIAMTGESGVERAIKMKPDFVVLDLVLPDISGFEVCARIRKEEALRNTIIIVLSVKDDLDNIRKAFDAGADDYVIKLPDPELLVRKIKLYSNISR
jgi:DNA-binding response OmpR family regulator